MDPIIYISDFIYLENMPDKNIKELQNILTYKNPAYDPRDNEPYTLKSYKLTKEGIKITRGCLQKLKNYLLKYRQHTFIIDERRTLDPIDVKLNFKLRGYQERVRDILCEKIQGVFVAGCGSGKTLTLLSTIPILRQPTLIIVHTADLMTQWISQIKSKLKGKFRIGQIGDDNQSLGQITVGLVQSLSRWKNWEQLDEKFGCVMCDEMHHIPANTLFEVANKFSAKYRFGASATPYRKDEKEFLIFDTIGPILEEISDNELEKAGHITSCKILRVNTNYFTRSENWHLMISSLVGDMERNSIILKNIMNDVEEGKKVLVLSLRREHCKLLNSFLESKGIRSKLLLGNVTRKAEKEKRKKVLTDEDVDVIVATTNLAREGLDKPDLGSIHLTCPSNNKGALKQMCGRVRRIHESKKGTPLVYDYIDNKTPALDHMGHNRKRWCKEWFFEIEEI